MNGKKSVILSLKEKALTMLWILGYILIKLVKIIWITSPVFLAIALTLSVQQINKDRSIIEEKTEILKTAIDTLNDRTTRLNTCENQLKIGPVFIENE